MTLGKIEEILIVVLVILLLFGSKKIPELAKNLGKSVKEIKRGFNEGEEGSESKSTKTKSK